MATKDDFEFRSVVDKVEVRSEAGGMTVVGYAAVFNQRADIGGYFGEVIAPGAFKRSITEDDIHAYYAHDGGRVLGRKSAGTLRLSEDARGLSVEIDLPNTTDGNDVRELVSRGDVSGMSFGFRVTREEWDETSDPPTRTIHEVRLYEVSPVPKPAYEGTTIAMRSLDAARVENRKRNSILPDLRERIEAGIASRAATTA